MTQQLSLLETTIANKDLFGNPIILDMDTSEEVLTPEKRCYVGEYLIPGLEGPLFSYQKKSNSRIN